MFEEVIGRLCGVYVYVGMGGSYIHTYIHTYLCDARSPNEHPAQAAEPVFAHLYICTCTYTTSVHTHIQIGCPKEHPAQATEPVFAHLSVVTEGFRV